MKLSKCLDSVQLRNSCAESVERCVCGKDGCVRRFDFSQPGSLKKRDSSEVRVESQVEGTVDAIFMWWDLEMDPDGEIILTCAPRWAHPDSTNLPVSLETAGCVYLDCKSVGFSV